VEKAIAHKQISLFRKKFITSYSRSYIKVVFKKSWQFKLKEEIENQYTNITKQKNTHHVHCVVVGNRYYMLTVRLLIDVEINSISPRLKRQSSQINEVINSDFIPVLF